MNVFTFIKNHCSILDVVQEYTNLKRAGLYWKGTCPFHHEKTASFTVSPHKGIFYCFGCHAGGDVIAFISKAENCPPLHAAQHLAQRYQIALPEPGDIATTAHEYQDKERHFFICKAACAWFQSMLQRSATAQAYLTQRTISPETARTFCIGYFPGGQAALRSFLSAMKQQAILAQDLLNASILAQGASGLYSPFEERIIFPIKDHLGRFCGFGGRIISPEDTRAKYYNSRENHFFNKGSLLFGLDQAKKTIQTTGSVFLVEGYIDCAIMVHHGYVNTVATLGTACTLEHLTTIARYAPHVIVLYDGDHAGQQAIMRLAELCWQASVDLYVARLPSGHDPASFLQSGQQLQPLINQATELLTFFVETLGSSFATQPLGEKIRLARKILITIAHVQEALKRDLLLQKAAATLGIPLPSLQRELEELLHKKPQAAPAPADQEAPILVQQLVDQKLEKRLFFAIMDNLDLFTPRLGVHLATYLPKPFNGILQKLISEKEAQSSITFSTFFEILTQEEQRVLGSALLAGEREIQQQEFSQLVAQFQRKHWKRITHAMKIQLAQAKRNGDHQTVEKIMHEFLEFKQALLQKDLV